jgi:hypothetical protein
MMQMMMFAYLTWEMGSGDGSVESPETGDSRCGVVVGCTRAVFGSRSGCVGKENKDEEGVGKEFIAVGRP